MKTEKEERGYGKRGGKRIKAKMETGGEGGEKKERKKRQEEDQERGEKGEVTSAGRLLGNLE